MPALGPGGAVSHAHVPAIMLDPSKLARGDRWTHRCSYCPVTTQGGRNGLNAHLLVCHPDKVHPSLRK